jgi:hypothetical protein
MKKYIKPSVEVIEMETAQVIANSGELSQQGDFNSNDMKVLESRNRGAAWSDYEGE